MHKVLTARESSFAGQIHLSSFWRKWYYFAIAIPLACALGALHYWLVTPTYQVTARILVEERDRPLGQHGSDAKENTNFLPTHAEIISSPAVITQAVSRMKTPPPAKPDRTPVEAVLERLEVQPLVGTHVLSISYIDENSESSIDGLRQIIQSYQDYLKESEQTSHQQTILLLATRADKLRAEMRELQTVYEDLRRRSPLLGGDHDAASIQRGMLTRLNEELMQTKSRQIALSNQLQTVIALRSDDPGGPLKFAGLQTDDSQKMNDRASIELLSRLSADGLISGVNPQTDLETLLQSELEYAELRKRYGERHPDVQAVAERISALNQRLAGIVDQAPGTIRQEVKSLERQEAHLTALYKKEFGLAKKIDEYLVKEHQKLDEIELVKSAHDTIVAQLNELQIDDQAVTDGRSSVSVHVLDGPELTDELVWPQPKPLLALCILAGLAGGAVLVVLTEKMWQGPLHHSAA